jgi:hypothetical protein
MSIIFYVAFFLGRAFKLAIAKSASGVADNQYFTRAVPLSLLGVRLWLDLL